MSKEVMQMALDALQENWRSDKSDLAIEALHAALAQQNSSSSISSNSDPVASVTISHYKGLSNRDMDYWGSLPKGTHQLYTAPPQRKEWVGLTYKEVKTFAAYPANITADLVRQIEAKLKEKNA